jgi:predicted enzyme related to lactoylglutathione lyase
MKRVTGIGGIFFKAKDPARLYEWYAKHLDVVHKPEQGGVVFPWKSPDDPEKSGMTVFSIHRQETEYFDPSQKPFMINYRVENLDALLEALKAEGVEILPRRDESFGKFAWIIDPEGNILELWEPPPGL